MNARAFVARYCDQLIAIGLAGLYAVELLRYPGARDTALALALGICAALSLMLRRRVPLLGFALVVTLNAATSREAPRFEANSIAWVAVAVIALYSLGAWALRWQAVVGAFFVIGFVVVATLEDGETRPSDFFFFLVLLGLPWAIGVAIRLRRDKDAELRERTRTAALDTARAVADERARIARELHDVVSHALAVTVLQARGGRKLVGHSDDEAVVRVLRAIETTNTAALADMRRLLSLLRETDANGGRTEPAPSLERLDRLITQVRDSGLPVEVQVVGDAPPLPPGLDLSAYRIVQEALTNVLKHGGPDASARVELRYGADGLELAVTNRGREANGQSPGGHGLIGIRERVAVAGGAVQAGPTAGGYAVRARLPYLTEPQ